MKLRMHEEPRATGQAKRCQGRNDDGRRADDFSRDLSGREQIKKCGNICGSQWVPTCPPGKQMNEPEGKGLKKPEMID